MADETYNDPQKISLLADILTREQLAAELDVSVRTVDRWHNLRIGPPRIAIGKKRLYRAKAVRRWIEEREVIFEAAK